jgi:C4-dicarboxylate-specific signal transduction histidine kinase
MSSLFKPHYWRRALAVAGALVLIVLSELGLAARAASQDGSLAPGQRGPRAGAARLVEKHDFLPHAAARHPEVQHLLRTPGDAALRSRVNNYFADLQTTTGAAALYLVDRNGMTLASSNWNTPSSFVGESYRQRPYFEDAFGGRGLFYGLGLTTGQAGLFIAEPVRVRRRDHGVAVVKISLDPLERSVAAQRLSGCCATAAAWCS